MGAMKRLGDRFVRKPAHGLVARFAHFVADAAQRAQRREPGALKLLEQLREHVDFAHAAEPARQFLQTAVHLANRVAIQLENGQQLAETA